MSSKHKRPPVDSAIASLIGLRHTPEQMVLTARQALAAIKQNPDLVNHPDLVSAVADWGTKTDLVDTTEGGIKTTKATLGGLEAAQATNMAEERRSAEKVLTLITFVSNGSAVAIKAYGVGVRGRMLTLPTTDPPLGLLTKRGTIPGSVLLKWRAVRSQKGYLVQQATDPANPTGWSVPVLVPFAKYQPHGLVTGQTVYFRVAVQRSNGQSQWSASVSVVVP